ncbi:hypothetical protein JCM30566_14610 [Marinitoga arctica]
MDTRKILKNIFNSNIDELKFNNKLKKVHSLPKEKIKYFADNNKCEYYCTSDGKIYIKDRNELYLYNDFHIDTIDNIDKIIQERKKNLFNKDY